MQTSLPTHVQQPAEPRLQFGPITGAIYAAGSAALGTVVCIACTSLGSAILRAAGHEAVNMPGYKELLIPTLVGTTTVAGGLGFIAGCCSPDARTV